MTSAGSQWSLFKRWSFALISELLIFENAVDKRETALKRCQSCWRHLRDVSSRVLVIKITDTIWIYTIWRTLDKWLKKHPKWYLA